MFEPPSSSFRKYLGERVGAFPLLCKLHKGSGAVTAHGRLHGTSTIAANLPPTWITGMATWSTRVPRVLVLRYSSLCPDPCTPRVLPSQSATGCLTSLKLACRTLSNAVFSTLQ